MAVLLDDEDKAAVLALSREESPVREIALVRRIRDLGDALAHNGPTTGPVPSSWSGTVSRSADVDAFTYAMRFGRRNVWKIGYTQDVKERLREINKHVPYEVLNEQWAVVFQQKWPKQQAAYDMEQRVLKALRKEGDQGERLSCTESELLTAWRAGLLPG